METRPDTITGKVDRKHGGMPTWAVLGMTLTGFSWPRLSWDNGRLWLTGALGRPRFFFPYTSDINGKRFLTRFIILFTRWGGCHITRISMADDQRAWPHDHSATFLSFRLIGSYEEDVYTDPGDLTKVEHRTHRWLSATRLRHTEAHSITTVSRPLVTVLFLGRRRQTSKYWTPDGPQPLGMTMDLKSGQQVPVDEWS